jgi:hypothetical protein
MDVALHRCGQALQTRNSTMNLPEPDETDPKVAWRAFLDADARIVP